MSQHGKIARLPRNIRDELNRRIDNGWVGVRLVEWLNSLPEVKQLLESDFDGREITEENLSNWKAHGYLRWQAQQESLELARELNTNAGELAASGGELSDSLARLVTVRFGSLLYDWNGEMTDEIRAKLRGLRGLSREVVRLRRSDQFLERIKIERKRLALESKASNLNKRRYEDFKRSTEAKAMEFCLDETKGYPESREAFKEAFAVFHKARAAGNGGNSENKVNE